MTLEDFHYLCDGFLGDRRNDDSFCRNANGYLVSLLHHVFQAPDKLAVRLFGGIESHTMLFAAARSGVTETAASSAGAQNLMEHKGEVVRFYRIEPDDEDEIEEEADEEDK